MDPTSVSEELKTVLSEYIVNFVTKVQSLEEENKNLKLKILEFEKNGTSANCSCIQRQEQHVNPSRKTLRRVVSESNLMRTQQIPMAVHPIQIQEVLGDNRTSPSVLCVSSEGMDFPFDEMCLKEEPGGEIILENLQTETTFMDEDTEIDIKEEDVDFLQPKSKSDGVNSIQDNLLISSVNVDNPSQMPVDEIVPTVLLQANQRFCEQKKKKVSPYLRTRPAEKITCKRCSLNFNNQLQLMEHNKKYRKGGKCISVNLKLKCSVCEKSYATTRLLALHKISHNGDKPTRSLQVDIGDKGKKRLSVEKAKSRGQGRLKKKRKVETTAKVCNGEEMPGVIEGLDPPCVDETNPLEIEFNQLKSLSLDTMINPQNILDKILASSGPPVLRELSLRYDISRNTEDNIVVHNILKSVAPTLKSLIFRESLFSRNSGNPRTMRFPILPHLEHLGLEYDIGINLNEETFPSLKSIEVPIGLYFTPSPVHSEENQINSITTEFPNLIQLVLRVGPTTPGLGSLKRALEHLHTTFPTLSMLSFVNVGGNDCEKHVLDLIRKSNLYKIKSIEEIRMIGFKQGLSVCK